LSCPKTRAFTYPLSEATWLPLLVALPRAATSHSLWLSRYQKTQLLDADRGGRITILVATSSKSFLDDGQLVNPFVIS